MDKESKEWLRKHKHLLPPEEPDDRVFGKRVQFVPIKDDLSVQPPPVFFTAANVAFLDGSFIASRSVCSALVKFRFKLPGTGLRVLFEPNITLNLAPLRLLSFLIASVHSPLVGQSSSTASPSGSINSRGLFRAYV